ncbi:glycoside hydrolase family 30 beta sandwich domain-containing protein [Chitinophaga sp.]|uniref:glycoside hydrolase family 30 beta sandwich domain-containing protein n=1 Tax=Chitinophaga sp. TaxID=1869181 RepID=UPI002F95AF15
MPKSGELFLSHLKSIKMKPEMFKNSRLVYAAIALMAFGCTKPNVIEIGDPPVIIKPAINSSATLDWNTTYQPIQGFGVFAGRAIPFFESVHRDTVLAKLFGDNGLRLNMIRGEIHWSCAYNPSNWNVALHDPRVDITTDPQNAVYKELDWLKKQELSQLWILKKAKERYKVPVIYASAWTPPLAMRINPKSEKPGTMQLAAYVNAVLNKKDTTGLLDAFRNGNGFATGADTLFNTLNFKTSANSYANYIAGYLRAHQKEGISIYGVSPSNEPDNIAAEWANCVWSPRQLGQFISNNLRPVLNSSGFSKVKILSPEAASWAASNDYLNGFSKPDSKWWLADGINLLILGFRQAFFGEEPMDRSNIDIYATHCYADAYDAEAQLNTGGKAGGLLDLKPGSLAVSGKPIWVTEASDATAPADTSMAEGLHLGINIFNALTTGNASAYTFWLGLLDTRNNEALIWEDGPAGKLTYPKLYDVMGNFSRYIGAGYVRIGATQPNADLRITAFKDPASGKFSIVVINSGTADQHCTLSLTGFKSGRLTGYLTSDASSSHWQSAVIPVNADGTFSATVPAKSIITYTGVKK